MGRGLRLAGCRLRLVSCRVRVVRRDVRLTEWSASPPRLPPSCQPHSRSRRRLRGCSLAEARIASTLRGSCCRLRRATPASSVDTAAYAVRAAHRCLVRVLTRSFCFRIWNIRLRDCDVCLQGWKFRLRGWKFRLRSWIVCLRSWILRHFCRIVARGPQTGEHMQLRLRRQTVVVMPASVVRTTA